MRRALLACLLLFGALAAPRRAGACASCACGDPTLTLMGREIPFAGRLRLAAELRYREDRVGREGIDEVRLREGRMELSVVYSPAERLTLSLTLPVLLRELRYVNLAREVSGGLGDMELRARLLLFRDRRFSPRHLLSLHAGARLPPGPPSIEGPTNPDLLPSTGAIDPLLGLSYVHLRGDLSLYGSLQLYVPTPGALGIRAPLSMRGTLSAQAQPLRWLAVQLGADVRLDSQAYIGDEPEPDSGGFIAFLSPGVVFRPRTDLLVYAIVRVPVVQALWGAHHEGPIASLGFTIDL